ncbi:MAG: type II toxin-antitoxin system VapC family toxin [Candidatus Aminicenantes bacterium]|nr:type II toxin-antitoxin system VapC family toxin [Candidatus Aminicenantes bacterium]
MDIVLVDTDIVSFIFKGDNRVQPYTPFLKEKILAVSFMTVAELFQWAAVRNWGVKRIKQLEDTLNNYLMLPCDIELCRRWGKVRANRRKAGHPISPQDAWVAATALRYEIPIATYNLQDFKRVEGLKLIRPDN